MINLNVGPLDKITSDSIAALFGDEELFSLIRVKTGIILICHGSKDGEISDIVLSVVRNVKRRGDNIVIVCCYPGLVKYNNPDIADCVLGNWREITNIIVTKFGHMFIYPNSEIVQ